MTLKSPPIGTPLHISCCVHLRFFFFWLDFHHSSTALFTLVCSKRFSFTPTGLFVWISVILCRAWLTRLTRSSVYSPVCLTGLPNAVACCSCLSSWYLQTTPLHWPPLLEVTGFVFFPVLFFFGDRFFHSLCAPLPEEKCHRHLNFHLLHLCFVYFDSVFILKEAGSGCQPVFVKLIKIKRNFRAVITHIFFQKVLHTPQIQQCISVCVYLS